MASEAEEFILRLNEQISPSARVAESSVVQLEARIAQQTTTLQTYESELVAARAKLEEMGQAAGKGSVNIRAYQRQRAAVEKLQEKVDSTRASLEALDGARGVAAQVSEFERAEQAIRSAGDALEELRARQALVGSSGGNIDGFTQQIEEQRQAVIKAQQAYVGMGGSARIAAAAGGNLGGAVSGAGEAAKVAATNYGELSASFGALGGPLGTAGAGAGAVADAFQKLKAAGPAAYVAGLAAVFVALAAAVAVAVAAATKWVVTMADAARSQALTVAGLEANYAQLRQLGEILPRVAARSGLANDEIQSLAEQLAKAKVPAENMEAALTAMATAQAGGASAEYLDKLQASLVKTGEVAPQLAAQFERFEAIAAAKLLSLDVQAETFKRNVSKLFGGLDIEPLLRGLARLVSMFDTTTGEAEALQFLLGVMFQPLIDGAAAAVPTIEAWFLRVQIAALETYIEYKRFMDSEDGARLRWGLGKVAQALRLVGLVASFVGGVLVAPFRDMERLIRRIAPALRPVADGFMFVESMAGQAAQSVRAEWNKVTAWLRNVDLAEVGLDMMRGLAKGIIDGGRAVFGAIEKVVNGAITGAKNLLEEKSPSRVFMRSGANISRGLAVGVEQEIPVVREAMRKMVPRPDAPANDVKPSGPIVVGGSGKTVNVSFSNCSFGGDLTKETLREWVTEIFQDEDALAEAG